MTIVRPERALTGPSSDPVDLDFGEKELFNIIKEGRSSLDALQTKTGAPPSGLMSRLLSLQLKKIIRELPGKIYELVHGS